MLEVEFDSSKDLAFGWNMMLGSFTKMLQFVEQIVSQGSICRACFRPKTSPDPSICILQPGWASLGCQKRVAEGVHGMPFVLT